MSPNVLVINDDPAILKLFCALLERSGCQTADALDGDKGLELLYRLIEPPDIIVCDDMMPGMHGTEVLEFIRNSPDWYYIPFLMTTVAYQYDHLCSDNTDYIRVPFQPPQLMKQIWQLLMR